MVRDPFRSAPPRIVRTRIDVPRGREGKNRWEGAGLGRVRETYPRHGTKRCSSTSVSAVKHSQVSIGQRERELDHTGVRGQLQLQDRENVNPGVVRLMFFEAMTGYIR